MGTVHTTLDIEYNASMTKWSEVYTNRSQCLKSNLVRSDSDVRKYVCLLTQCWWFSMCTLVTSTIWK